MKGKQLALVVIAVVALAAASRLLYSILADLAWLLVLAVPIAALAKVLTELPPPPPPQRRLIYAKPLARVLEDLVTKLPGTEGSLKSRLEDLLAHRLAARMGSTVSEARSRALELVKDPVLIKLLKGELRIRSASDVLEVLERIDRL